MKTIGKKILTTFIILILAIKSTGFSQNIAAYASSDEQSDISGSASTSTEESVSVTADPAGSDPASSGKEAAYKENIILIDDRFSSFEDAVCKLEYLYGKLRIRSITLPDERTSDTVETNGLCFLSLTDFDNDGIDDLFAVCKSEEEFAYTCYLFMKEDEEVKCVFKNDCVTYTSDDYIEDSLFITRNSETGCRLRAGHSDADDYYSYVYGFDKGDFRLIETSCKLWSEEQNYYNCFINDRIIEGEENERQRFFVPRDWSSALYRSRNHPGSRPP